MESCRFGVKALPALSSRWPAKLVIVSGRCLWTWKMEWVRAHSWSRRNMLEPVSNNAFTVVGPSVVANPTGSVNR
jgi:hypothetical protein